MKDLISDLRPLKNGAFASIIDAFGLINFFKDSSIEDLEEKIIDEECYLRQKFYETQGMLFEQIKDILWEIESKPYHDNKDSINFMREQMLLYKDYSQRIKWLSSIKARLIQINGDDENGKRNERKIFEDSFRASA